MYVIGLLLLYENLVLFVYVFLSIVRNVRNGQIYYAPLYNVSIKVKN